MATNESNNLNKKRSRKTTQRQYEIMVNFIENHPKMITGKLSPTFTAKDRDDLWKELAEILNSDGFGPMKTHDKWRRTWIDIKSEVKNKAAEITVSQKLTGSGAPPAPLPILWEKIRAMIDPVLIIGDSDVRETVRAQDSVSLQSASVVQSAEESDINTIEYEFDSSVLDASICIMDVEATPSSAHAHDVEATPSSAHAHDVEATPTTSASQKRPTSDVGGRLPKLRRKNFVDLLQAESSKVEAINKLTECLEKSNNLKKEELILRTRELNIQEERNKIFNNACKYMVEIANAFLSK